VTLGRRKEKEKKDKKEKRRRLELREVSLTRTIKIDSNRIHINKTRTEVHRS